MQVLAQEYTAIRKAGLDLEEGYTPPITYITVLKRHNARLFPTNADADDGGGNVRPGVCVDSGITLANGFDFYLNSHKGIQGTVRTNHHQLVCRDLCSRSLHSICLVVVYSAHGYSIVLRSKC